jgi:DNA-directed RNA polymerase specialized sigma24 family protein
MGRKTQTGSEGGEGEKRSWVDRPITDEQLEAAWRELRVTILLDVVDMLRDSTVRPFKRELVKAVEFAFEEAAIRRPGHPRPRAWLRTVAYRTAVQLALKRRREDKLLEHVAEIPEDRVRHGRPGSVPQTVEVLEALDAIAHLDEQHRRAFGLEIAGYGLDEIAAMLRVSRYEARWLIAESRHALRAQLRS